VRLARRKKSNYCQKYSDR